MSAPRVSTDKHLCLRQTAWRREGRGDLASPWLVPEFPNWPGIIGRFVFQHDIATCLLVASWRLHLSMRHLSLSSAGYRIGPPFPSAADE